MNRTQAHKNQCRTDRRDRIQGRAAVANIPLAIATALAKASWFRLVPEHLDIIDNRQGLRHRDEIDLGVIPAMAACNAAPALRYQLAWPVVSSPVAVSYTHLFLGILLAYGFVAPIAGQLA